MTFANSAITNAKNGNIQSWRRVDIFWSDSDTNNWDINKYYAPHYDLIEKDGILKKANTALNLRKDKGKPNSQIVDYAQKDYQPTSFMGSSRAPIDAMLQEAARIHAKKRSDSIVCTQVSQWIIIQVKTYHEIIDGDYSTFPNMHIWGFLQPASIGGDTKRREEENGWVTDDIPRAGWYEAQVIWEHRGGASNFACPAPAYLRFKQSGGKKQVADTVCPYSRQPSDVQAKIPYRLIKNDDGSCNTIQIKVKAIIRNDETKEDRDRKHAQLKGEVKSKLQNKGTSQEKIRKIISSIDRFEAGSYMKVWVRNLDVAWLQPPLDIAVSDNETESCMRNMQDVDSPKEKSSMYIFRDYKNTPPIDKEDSFFRPYAFRNHTWKRNKVVIHAWGENTGSEDAYARELVYILLLPTEVLDKIDKLFTDKQVEKTAKDPTNSWILPLSVSISFFVMLAILRKIKKNQNNPDRFQTMVDALDLPKHAAILASMTPATDKATFLKNFQNNKLHDVFKNDPASSTFSDGRQRICQFFAVMFQQAYVFALKAGDEEYEKFLADYEKRKDAFWNRKQSTDTEMKLGLGQSDDNLINISAQFASFQSVKKLAGSKLPGYFCWLEWAVLLKLGFGLGAQIQFGKKKPEGASGSTGEERYYLNGSLDPKGIVSLAVELGAVWSMVNQEDSQADIQEAWQWAETIKYILTWVELKLGVALSLKSEGKLGFDIDFLSANGAKTKAIFDKHLKIDHTLSLDSQIYATISNLVQIDYSALHYVIMHLTGSGVSIGSDLFVGGNRVAGVKPYSFIWGDVQVYRKFAWFENPKAVLGQNVTVYSYYRGQPDLAQYGLDICAKVTSLSNDNYKHAVIFSSEICRERADTPDNMPSYEDKITITNDLLIDDSFFTTPTKKAFLKKLIEEDQIIHGEIFLNEKKEDENIKGKTSKADSECILPSPHVAFSAPTKFSLKDTIKVGIVIYNFCCKIPIYLWVYEDDDYCDYTGDNRKHCMKIPPLIIMGTYSAKHVEVSLEKFKIMSNVRNELLYGAPFMSHDANVSFRVSLDPDGEFMLKSKDINDNMVETILSREISVE